MSAQSKTKAQKAGKFLGIALFAFLMLFNIKFAIGDNSNSDIDLLGLKVSVSTNSTYAYSGCHDICTWVPDTICTYIVGEGFCSGYWR